MNKRGDNISYYLAITVNREALIVKARGLQDARRRLARYFGEMGFTYRYLFKHHIASITKVEHVGFGIYRIRNILVK